MKAPYRECPWCWEESVMTDDAEDMGRCNLRTTDGYILEYWRQAIVKCENCHRSLEVNYDGDWNGSWHDLTTIRPLKALPL